MNNRQKELLLGLGITTERYYSEANDDDQPWVGPTWGIALVKDGRDIAVIEDHAHSGGPKRYWVRNVRTGDGEIPTDWSRPYTKQRLAIGGALEAIYA